MYKVIHELPELDDHVVIHQGEEQNRLGTKTLAFRQRDC